MGAGGQSFFMTGDSATSILGSGQPGQQQQGNQMRPQSARPHNSGMTSRVCNLYLQSDTFLWDHVIKLPHIRFNRDLAIKEITSIFTQHVQGAQAIYQYTNFKDASDSNPTISSAVLKLSVLEMIVNDTDTYLIETCCGMLSSTLFICPNPSA
ncbi:unnamed protein product [Rodentolepis nana]|uniref:Uncharacterized protein n=1 Tax=Rodentolepis nana TaxID=102285 RepID=A0A3P7T895_RODNA|nr:unnamed protein product [Rodentolepis nana]